MTKHRRNTGGHNNHHFLERCWGLAGRLGQLRPASRGDRRLSVEQLERRELLSIQPVATPFVPVDPTGSLVYDQEMSGEIGLSGEVDQFSVDLGPDHAFSVLVESESELRPTIELYGPGSALLGSSTATSASGSAVLQAQPAAGNGTYTVAIGGADSTTGEYTFTIVVDAALEAEEAGGTTNDTLAAAQDLDSAFLAFDSGAIQRAALVGTLPGYGENFESGRLDGAWTASASESGVVEVAGYGGVADGTNALMLHYRRGLRYETPDGSQSATWTVDLADLESPVLSFRHARFYEEAPNLFDGSFVDSYDADGVAISADGVHWHPIDGLSYDVSSEVWISETVDLEAEATAAGIELGDDFHIRFQQFSDRTILNPLSGRGFDQILITSQPDEDWYRFSLDDGQSASVTLGQNSYGKAMVELYDGRANLLATGVPAENATWTIGNFVDTTSDGGAEEYFVRVAGEASDYSLVVSRDTDFEASASEGGFSSPQHLVPGRAVQGAIYRPTPGVPTDVMPAPVDIYALEVVSGDTLRIETLDLPDNPLSYPEQFHPVLELRDPAGSVVSMDCNGAFQGQPALILHQAASTGTYTVRVRGQSGSHGEYALLATGQTGAASFQVSGTMADASVAVTEREEFEVHFSDGILLTSIDAGDLTIDGQAAASVTVVDGNTLAFEMASSLADGSHQIAMAGGAVSALDGRPLEAYAAGFVLDTTTPHIIASSLNEGDVVDAGTVVAAFTFSEALDPDTIDEKAITLIDGRGVAYSPARFDLAADNTSLEIEFAAIPDGAYTLTLSTDDGRFRDPAGHILDAEAHGSTTVPSGDGEPGGNFVVRFGADTDELSLADAFRTIAPLGALAQLSTLPGAISTPTDTDTYTLELDPNQAVSVAVVGSPELRPTISLHGPGGGLLASSSAGSVGLPAVLSQPAATAGGTYRVVVSAAAGTSGEYQLEVLLNATLEQEAYGAGSNDATAQSLDGAFLNVLGGEGQRAAVRGQTQFRGEDFESGVLDENWSTTFQPLGQRIEVTSAHGAAGGDFALWMDRVGDQIDYGGLSSAIWTIDLTGIERPILGFSHASWESTSDWDGGYRSGLPAYMDGVMIGGDTVANPIWQPPLQPLGDWEYYTIDLVAEAAKFNYDISDRTRLIFNWMGNNEIPIEGRGFDDLAIFTGEEFVDWYSFSLDDGQSASVSLATVVGSDAKLELYDSQKNLLASGVAADNLEQAIESFVDRTSDGAVDEYLVRVVTTQAQGPKMDYQLVVSRDAVLELEADGPATTTDKELPEGRVALGYLAGAGVADEDAEDFYVFQVAAGDNLVIETRTPESGTDATANQLDPKLELHDAAGTLLANDDNGASLGLNARLTHTADATGTYRLRVSAADGTAGEYVLQVNGRSAGAAMPFEMASASLADGEAAALFPLDVTFNDEILWSTVEAGDLIVNGVPAVSVERIDESTARFGVATLGVGTWQVTMAAGSVRDLQGTPLEGAQAVVITPASDTILPGSLAHRLELAGELATAATEDGWNVLLKAGQTVAVQVTPSDTLAPSITVLNPAGTPIASVDAAAGHPTLLQSLTVATTGEYRVVVGVASGSGGGYEGVVAVNAALEAEEAGGQANNTRAGAVDLDGVFLSTPDGTGRRAAVLGSLPQDAVILAEEEFDNHDLSEQENPWTLYSSNIRKGETLVSAKSRTPDERRLTMREDGFGKRVILWATWTVDLTGHTEPLYLDFIHMQSADEPQPFAPGYPDASHGVGISISNDGVNFHPIWVAPEMLEDVWMPFSLDLTAAAAEVGIAIGDELQIKFTSLMDDRDRLETRHYDAITISTRNVTEDWYRFSLADGESAALALEAPHSASLEVYDDQGNLISASEPAKNAMQEVHGLVDTTTDGTPDTYYVRVSGIDTDYSLLVTRGAEFEAQRNDRFDTAQDLGSSSIVLGHGGDDLAWTDPGVEPVGADDGPGSIGLTASWPGTEYYEGRLYRLPQPDPAIAVGPNQVVTVFTTSVNDRETDLYPCGVMAVYDRASGDELYRMTTYDLFSPFDSNRLERQGEARLLFDPHSQRFIATMSQQNYIGHDQTNDVEALSYLHVAVSTTATPTSPDDWHRTTVDVTHVPTDIALGEDAHWSGVASLAVDENTLWLAGAYVPIWGPASGEYTGLIGIDKAQLLAEGSFADIVYRDYFDGPRLHAVSQMGASDTQYFVQPAAASGDSLTIHAVRKTAGGYERTTTALSVPAYDVAELFATKESNLQIDSYSPNISSAVLRDGSLYVSHTIQEPAVDVEQAVVRWYEIEMADTSFGAASLKQWGNIDAGPEKHAWNSALAVDGDGNLAVSFLTAGPDQYITAVYTGRMASDPLGEITKPLSVLAEGEGPYIDEVGGYCRLAVQSGLVVDPTDDSTFWAYNIHGNDTDAWDTHVGAFQLESTTGDDWYRFKVAAGETITLETFAADPTALGSAGDLNPALELYDPAGNLVATNEDGAADNRNARLTYTATVAGSWRVRVIGQDESFGAYSLTLDRTADLAAVEVVSGQPDDGFVGIALPDSWSVTFSQAVRDASVQAADLTVGGKPTLSVERTGLRTYRFSIDPTVNTGDGIYSVQMAAGAVTDVHGKGNVAYQDAFDVDSSGPRVQQIVLNGQAASPGHTMPEGPATIRMRFSEDLALFADSLDTPFGSQSHGIELVETLSGIPVSFAAVAYDPGQRILTLEIDQLQQGSYMLTVRADETSFQDALGNLMDGDGNGTPGGDYTFGFSVDRSASGEWTLEHANPLGGQILLGRDPLGWINQADDQDGYTFFVEAGTILSVVARPEGAAAQLSVELVGISTAVAATPGQDVALAPVVIPNDGFLTVKVGGNETTQFDLTVTGNAVIEVTDSTAASPMAIDASRIDAGRGRAAVVGTSTPDSADIDLYTLDMTGRGGERIDVILAGQGDVDMTGATIEILDTDSITVLAAANGDPAAPFSLNYDLGIHDFEVPAAGVYSIRVSSESAGQYGLVVTSSAVFDTEKSGADPREIDAGGSALGHIGAEIPLLFAVQWEMNAAAVIHTLDTSTGAIINSFDAPATSRTNPYGLNLAFDGDYLYFNSGARYGDDRVFVLDARDGTIVREFRAAESGDNVYGLAFLGDELFVMDGDGEELDAYSPETGEYLRSIPSPEPHLTGLSGDLSTGTLWGVDQRTYTVMQIDPQTGEVLNSAPSRVGSGQGMAVLGDELFVSHTAGPGLPGQEVAVYDAATLEVLRRFRVDIPTMLAGLGGDGVPARFKVEASPQPAQQQGPAPAVAAPSASYATHAGYAEHHADDSHSAHVGLCSTCLAGYGVDDPIPPAIDRLSDQASDPLILEEIETNDTLIQAMPVPLGLEAHETSAVLINGSLSETDTSDKFLIELDAGDVINIRSSGATERVALRDSRGFNLMTSVYNAGRIAPDSSPVASAGRASLAWVVSMPGTYYVDVFDGVGDYFLDLQVLRPALESQPLGSHQILFLDFDGASVDTSEFRSGGDVVQLSPLVDFLPRWGLDPQTDLDAVIDAILLSVEENLSADLRQSGLNGDFDATGIAGQFDIEILNSRDHGEQFGNPNVSRVVIGGTMNELGIPTIGIAGSIDVGNFNTEESAVVLLDYISDPEPPDHNTATLNRIPLDSSASKIDLVGTAVGNIASHEAGHFFANWHTWNRSLRDELMDSGGNFAGMYGLGPDGVFGSDDDIDVDFGHDVFSPWEAFQGMENTLAGIAFGLSTGTRDPALAGPGVDEIDLHVPVGDRSIIDHLTLRFSEALEATAAADAGNYQLIHAGENGVFDFGLVDDRIVPLTAVLDGETAVELTVDGAFAPLAPGRYQLTLAGNDAGIVDLDGNPLKATAGPGTGQAAVFRFDVAVPRNADLYTLKLVAGDTVTLWTETPLDNPLSSSESPLDPSLRVRGPSGNWVAADEDSGDQKNAMVTFTVPESGMYSIYVTAESGEGSYVLRSDLVEGPPSVAAQSPGEVAANSVDSMVLTFTHPMDPNSFTVADDIVSLTGPNGDITPTGHSWKSPNELEISFPTQTTIGVYEFVLAPAVTSTAGFALDQDRDGTPGETPDDQYAGSFTLITATDFGYVLNDELNDLDPSQGELAYRLTATHSGFLSVVGKTSTPGTTLTLRLRNEATGEEVTSVAFDGGQRVDTRLLADGHAILYISGTSTDVDLKLVNLVEHVGTTVTVHGTEDDDQFGMDASDGFEVSLNGLAYALTSTEVALVTFDGGTGDDEASITGSSGNEEAMLYPDHGEMTGVGWKATFTSVAATELIGGGGADSVQMYDSPGNDHYESAPGLSTLSGPGYQLIAKEFGVSHAYGKEGGTDTAAISGPEEGRVKFKADNEGGWSKMYGSGFFSRAKFFEQIDAHSHNPRDYARLFDSKGDDTFTGQMNESRMVSADYDITLHGFTQLIAYSRAGGNDIATLTDSAQNDEVRFRPHKTQMYDLGTKGDAYMLTVRAFDEVHAHATEGGDDDRAKLHDSAGDEVFEASGSTARMLTTKTEMELLYEAVHFEFVKAYRSEGSDRAEVDEPLAFDLYYDGDWQ
jgi:pre-peptidase